MESTKTGLMTDPFPERMGKPVVASSDQIKLNLPYAGTTLSIELLFHSEFPDLPPDFIWLTEEFPQEPDSYAHIARVWDSREKHNLRNFLAELIRVYKNYHLALLNNYPFAETRYATLISEGYPNDQLEIYCDTKMSKIWICVHLDVTDKFASNLPVFSGNSPNSQTIYAALHITMGTEGNITNRQLTLSPYLEQILNMQPETILLPTVSSSFSYDELVNLTESINDAICKVSRDFTARRHLTSVFLALFEDSVVSYDESSYLSVRLYFSRTEVRCVAHVELHPQSEVILFAPDVNVGISTEDKQIPYSEKFTLDFGNLTRHEALEKHVYEVFKSKVDDFLSRAVSLS